MLSQNILFSRLFGSPLVHSQEMLCVVKVKSQEGPTKLNPGLYLISTDSISDCWLHLIHNGITITGDSVFVEWQGTGPNNEQNKKFVCTLHGQSNPNIL